MRIVIALPGIGISGGARVLYEYANKLQGRGHEVYIVYPLVLPFIKPNIKFRDVVEWVKLSLYNLKIGVRVDWFDLRAKLIRIPSFSLIFSRLMDPFVPDADAVIASSWETAYFVSRLRTRKGNKYYFVQQYEIWDLWNDEGCWREAEKLDGAGDLCLTMYHVTPGDAKLQKIKELVDGSFKLPLNKITISTWLRKLIEDKFGEPVKGVIVNGVNFDTFYREDGVRAKDHATLLMPYRPMPCKGTEDGLNAFKRVREKHPGTRFILYGEKRLSELPEWVEFQENVSDDGLRALYNRADIFVSPSWTEGCQLPPMEAMACGCAVVSTNVGGVPDYGIDGETIVAVPPRNEGALTKAILRLIEDEGERKRIANNGYAHIRRFTWNNATDDFERILKNDAGGID
jgi:glycosyltransferase involved in cell wall biosynthesis